MKISQIKLNIIKDSRNDNTLEATMISSIFSVVSSVPAGKSKGKHEILSIDPYTASQKLEEVKREILDVDFSSILEFDDLLKKLDSTCNKSNLGGNLILVLSICFTKLFAKFNNLETYELIGKILDKQPQKFPYLFFNLIGGGLHAKDSLPFQEYLLVTKFDSPTQGLKYAKSQVEKIRRDILENFKEERYGDEGAFAVTGDNPALGLEILKRNLNSQNVSLALDAAATSFYNNGEYKIGEKKFKTDEMLGLYKKMYDKFHLLSIEDPFSEDDSLGFIKICQIFKDKMWIIGDDLTVTNADFIKKANEEKKITGVIIKPNQIGSVSETLKAIQLAQSLGLKIIVSHRSGETNDDFIADLSYGACADGLKSGAPTQEERLRKYNRLIEIENKLKY